MGSSFDPNGTVAMIAGASGCLGFKIALGLARAGALVVLHGRDSVRLRALMCNTSELAIISDNIP